MNEFKVVYTVLTLMMDVLPTLLAPMKAIVRFWATPGAAASGKPALAMTTAKCCNIKFKIETL